MINYFIFGISYAFACVVQPGPFQVFLISQSLTNGWRKTIPLVFAPLVSDLPIIILVLLVLTNVPHEVLLILQCFGGVFLLYLAFNAYKTWRIFNQNDKKDTAETGAAWSVFAPDGWCETAEAGDNTFQDPAWSGNRSRPGLL